jgi:hypothetical protein
MTVLQGSFICPLFDLLSRESPCKFNACRVPRYGLVEILLLELSLPEQTVSLDVEGRTVPTGNTAVPDLDHTATLLPSGDVLVAAGLAGKGGAILLRSGGFYIISDGNWNKSPHLSHPFPIRNNGERSLALPYPEV